MNEVQQQKNPYESNAATGKSLRIKCSSGKIPINQVQQRYVSHANYTIYKS